jgi:predicted enzyme related to lactoylglutathione lyase
MNYVTGIGGFFFRAKDPTALADWYERVLGITKIPDDYAKQPWQQSAGPTAFAPFPADTDYFGPKTVSWMLNLRVRELDKFIGELRTMDVEVKIDPEEYPNGRFARLHDPEGNPIELWEPKNA